MVAILGRKKALLCPHWLGSKLLHTSVLVEDCYGQDTLVKAGTHFVKIHCGSEPCKAYLSMEIAHQTPPYMSN